MWWYRRSGGKTNFGDEIGPEIIRRMGHTVTYAKAGEAELVACGSVLHASLNPDACIWGTGMMSAAKRPVRRMNNIAALRGELTLRDIKQEVPAGIPRADPALLVPEFFDPAPSKRYGLGLVRHYVDQRPRPKWADTVIEVDAPVEQVVEHITACRTIASSSLHGLLVAQAYGIPAVRLPHPRVGGADYKWLDAASAMDRPLRQVRRELLCAFPW